MPVPSPSIVPVVNPGGTYRATFVGPVGVVGSNQALNIDLKYLSTYYRSSANFRSQLEVVFKSLDDNLSFAGPDVLVNANFFDTPGQPNEYVQILVTAAAGTELCHVQVALIASQIR